MKDDNFIFKNGNYIAAVDFGSKDHNDIAVETLIKINKDGTCKILNSKRLGHSKEFNEKKRKEHLNYLEKLLNSYSLRLRIGELQTLRDNDDRDILMALQEGDYIIGYNGDRGTITEVNYPYIVVKYADIKRDIHVCDVKQFMFN